MKTTMTLVQTSETTKLFQDLSKPSLHALSYALRHPDTWPANFYWNYNFCEQCAMGLAHELWNSIPEANGKTGPTIMARHFAMPYNEAQKIFLGSSSWVPTQRRGFIFRWKELNLDKVTPDMVADQIDAYLKTAE